MPYQGFHALARHATTKISPRLLPSNTASHLKSHAPDARSDFVPNPTQGFANMLL